MGRTIKAIPRAAAGYARQLKNDILVHCGPQTRRMKLTLQNEKRLAMLTAAEALQILSTLFPT